MATPPRAYHGGPVAEPRPQLRWPLLLAVAASTALLTSVITAVITASAVSGGRTTSLPMTIGKTPSPPPARASAPLPVAQADQNTCAAFTDAGVQMLAADRALDIIPPEIAVLDPEVGTNPDWADAIEEASTLYTQAAQTLGTGITSGSTPLLESTARAFSLEIGALATAYQTYDPSIGDLVNASRGMDGAMVQLCDRLVPR